MAAKLGMTLRAYREWERPGRRTWQRVNQSPLVKLCDVTGVSLDWLIGCNDSARMPPDVPRTMTGAPMPQPTRH